MTHRSKKSYYISVQPMSDKPRFLIHSSTNRKYIFQLEYSKMFLPNIDKHCYYIQGLLLTYKNIPNCSFPHMEPPHRTYIDIYICDLLSHRYKEPRNRTQYHTLLLFREAGYNLYMYGLSENTYSRDRRRPAS